MMKCRVKTEFEYFRFTGLISDYPDWFINNMRLWRSTSGEYYIIDEIGGANEFEDPVEDETVVLGNYVVLEHPEEFLRTIGETRKHLAMKVYSEEMFKQKFEVIE